MNWDQIENNWMAMTRRVRPERPATAMPSADLLQPLADLAETSADWPEPTSPSVVSALRVTP